MYRNILVPVANPESRQARDAMDIARHVLAEGGKITLLTVIEDVPAYVHQFLPPDHLQKSMRDAADGLDALARETGATATDVVVGHAGKAIVEYAVENDMDCIVIASHRPDFQDLFLGSTAARVVRHAPCSVHVMR